MLELYGRQWEASFGHVDGAAYLAWRQALGAYTPRDIKRGLEHVIEEGADHPPNLVKFLRLCRKVVPPTTISEHPDYGQMKALAWTRCPADSPVVAREKDRMTELRKGGDVETKERSWMVLGLGARWGKP